MTVLLILWIWFLSIYGLLRGREDELDGIVLTIIIVLAPFLMLYWVFDWLVGLICNRE